MTCDRGCTIRGQHIAPCTCTNECPAHDNHCKGCLPHAAVVGHYCQRCTDRFRDALEAIPELVVRVASSPNGQIMRKQVAGDLSRKATKVDQASPSPAWDAADEVIMWAAAWAGVVSSGGTDPSRYDISGMPVYELSRSISYLLNRLTQILTDDYHADLYAETISTHRRLTIAAGMERLTHRIKSPCPSCGQRSLVRDNGADQVSCRNQDCQRVWRESEYDDLAQAVS